MVSVMTKLILIGILAAFTGALLHGHAPRLLSDIKWEWYYFPSLIAGCVAVASMKSALERLK